MSDALKDTFDTPRGCAFLYDGGTGTLCGRPERDSVHRAPSNDEDSNLYHAFVSLKATNATIADIEAEAARRYDIPDEEFVGDEFDMQSIARKAGFIDGASWERNHAK